jgi:adenylate cyclase
MVAYIPQDRFCVLVQGKGLPDRAQGTALFADISGFTQLTEKLTQELGARRGIEELSQQINTVYDSLIGEIHRYGGSVISFAGDSVTCWFDELDGQAGARTVTCAVDMQQAMLAFKNLALKIAITSGPARRLVVGDPDLQLIDTLAGETVARLATGEHMALRGEVLLDESTVQNLGEQVSIREWRAEESHVRFAILEKISSPIAAQPRALPQSSISLEVIRPWLHPHVYQQVQQDGGNFLTELRPVVALFIRFTGIDYDGDEQAGVQLDGFIRQVQAILQRYEGLLLQLTIGDKGSYLYAAFGAPMAHEDDAARAVRAALSIIKFPQSSPFLQPLQIGISQGMMRAGAYGGLTRCVYGALGDDANLAARLMTTAAAGEILISGRVYNQVSSVFSLEPRPPLPMKGKAEPLPVFVVTGIRHVRALRLEEPHYSLPMMGRKAELDLVNEKLSQALNGLGQVIGITAEAGMGKSRLVAEVIRLAQKRGFTGFGGACESSGTNTAYLVWKPIWQAFFNLDPAAPLRRQIRNLEGEIEDRAPDRVLALPVLSPLLDLPIEDNEFTSKLEPEDRRNVLAALLEDCLKSAASEEPLLLVLEDVHWIDALSHDLLEILARICDKLPVCILLAYRPPDLRRLQELRVEKLAHFTRLEINHLTELEAEQLVRAKLAQLFPERTGTLPRALAARLIDRSEGNPFYIEELLNYLRDRGFDPFDARALQSLDLPASLQVLILSRIDRLSEAQKVTLKTASIIGRQFSLSWLQGYYPGLGQQADVNTELARLTQLELTALAESEPETAYLFKHIITHEVAYESLPYATRAQLHEQLAMFLEKSYQQDNQVNPGAAYLDMLAFHFGRSENAAKQREYLRKAGDATRRDYANEAALEYYERLQALLSRPDELAELHLTRGNVLRLMGRWEEAENAFRQALAYSKASQDPQLLTRCQEALGALYRLRGNYPAALEWLTQAMTSEQALGDTIGQARVLIEIGIVHERKDDYLQARKFLESAMTLARERDEAQVIADALIPLGRIEAIQGHYAQAQAFYDESLALYRKSGDQRGVAESFNYLARLAERQGNYALSRSFFEESLQIRRNIGNKQGVADSLNNLGRVADIQGDPGTAQRLLEESLVLYREIGDRRGISTSLDNLGVRASNVGDFPAARNYHEESLALAREMGERRGTAWGLMNLGVVATVQGDYAQARSFYEECLSIFREIGDKEGIAAGLVNSGYTACEQNDYLAARDILLESLMLAHEINAQWGIIYSLVGLASAMTNLEKPTVAAQLAAAADRLRNDLQLAMAPDERRLYEQAVAGIRAVLTESELERLWETGKKLEIGEVLVLANSMGQ